MTSLCGNPRRNCWTDKWAFSVEYPGTPVSFGEPSRISCIVQFGEGEVIDVERKNELAGNIHIKV